MGSLVGVWYRWESELGRRMAGIPSVLGILTPVIGSLEFLVHRSHVSVWHIWPVRGPIFKTAFEARVRPH